LFGLELTLSRGKASSALGRLSPFAGRPAKLAIQAAECQEFLQKLVGSTPAGDDAQFVVKMVAGGLRRVADGRLPTPSLRADSSPTAPAPAPEYEFDQRVSW
jgi:hypothetical protein